MVEKPSRDPACPGSAVPAYWAQEKFPDKSGKYMYRLFICLPSRKRMSLELALGQMYAKIAPKPFSASLVWGALPVALAGHERSKIIRREKRE